MANLPVKRDVVYMFISEIRAGNGEDEYLRVQYLVTDNGDSALRAVVNAAAKGRSISCAGFN